MRCPFCQTEYSAEELARCPNCGMREEYARNKPEAIPAEKPERGKIRRSPLGYFWSALSKYASTRGRARRTEYFWFMLFAFTCWVGLSYGVRAILASFEFGEEIVRYLANLSFLAWNLPEIALLPDNTTMSLSMSEAELFAAENSLLRLALFPGAVLGAIQVGADHLRRAAGLLRVDHRLDQRQSDHRQDRDDRSHHQQLNECQPFLFASSSHSAPWVWLF